MSIISQEELDNLINVKQYFKALPTILVLPDDNIETLQRGMLLNPLYFLAKHAGLNQFSLAVSELCHIYTDHFRQPSDLHSVNYVPGALS